MTIKLNKVNKITTAELVREELHFDPYIRSLLQEDLINITALSRRLLPKIKEKNPKAKLESIAIALHREVDKGKKPVARDLSQVIKNSQLLTRNDVIHLTMERDSKNIEQVLSISRKVKWTKDELFLLNQGLSEINIILDKHNEQHTKTLKTLFRKENLGILIIKEHTITNTKMSYEVCGVYSYFLSLLARKNINLIEIISTHSQINLVVESKDLILAHRVIQEGIEHFRKS